MQMKTLASILQLKEKQVDVIQKDIKESQNLDNLGIQAKQQSITKLQGSEALSMDFSADTGYGISGIGNSISLNLSVSSNSSLDDEFSFDTFDDTNKCYPEGVEGFVDKYWIQQKEQQKPVLIQFKVVHESKDKHQQKRF